MTPELTLLCFVAGMFVSAACIRVAYPRILSKEEVIHALGQLLLDSDGYTAAAWDAAIRAAIEKVKRL